MNPKWEFDCPLCKKHVVTEHSIDTIKFYIGSTTNCPLCDGIVLINPDLTCSDFGQYLVDAYKGAGVNTTKEEALGNYVEVPENESSK